MRTAGGIDEAGLDGGLQYQLSRRERDGRGDPAFELEREGATARAVTLPERIQGRGQLSLSSSEHVAGYPEAAILSTRFFIRLTHLLGYETSLNRNRTAVVP